MIPKKQRSTWEWLVLVLWVEVVILLLLANYLREVSALIRITNLVMARPSPEFWVMMSNMGVILAGLGGALWWLRRYGVLMGLILFLFGLVVVFGVMW